MHKSLMLIAVVASLAATSSMAAQTGRADASPSFTPGSASQDGRYVWGGEEAGWSLRQYRFLDGDRASSRRAETRVDRTASPGKQAASEQGKTQRDLDREHDRLQSDGTYHPREVLNK